MYRFRLVSLRFMSTIPKVALLSASTKDEKLQAFATRLVSLDWEILASSGTKVFLEGHGIPSIDIGDIVGEPILGHRVVTLSREIHGGILANLEKPEDLAELARLEIRPISLVYVDFYPLERALERLRRGEITVQEAREMIDIGGPTLARAAAKAGRIVLASHHLIDEVTSLLEQHENPFDNTLAVNRLAWLAEHAVHEYTGRSLSFYRDLPMPTP